MLVKLDAKYNKYSFPKNSQNDFIRSNTLCRSFLFQEQFSIYLLSKVISSYTTWVNSTGATATLVSHLRPGLSSSM